MADTVSPTLDLDTLPGSAFINSEQLASTCTVTVAAVIAWRSRKTGGPRPTYLGRCVRYKVADVREWLAACAEGV